MRQLLLTATMLLGGCGIQTGPPLPDPVPNPNRLRATEPAEAQVDLLGLPGSVPGAGPLEVTSPQGTVRVQTTAAGTFWVKVRVSGLDSLTLKYDDEAPVTLQLRNGAITWEPGQGIQPEFAGDLFEVRLKVKPNQIGVMANLRSGEVVTETAGPTDTSLTLRIAAKTGDEVRAYLDGAALSEPLIYTVP